MAQAGLGGSSTHGTPPTSPRKGMLRALYRVLMHTCVSSTQ